MKETSPAFQFYPKDFLSDQHVISMTLAELGAYTKLLCICWIEKSLPNNEIELAKLCRLPPTKFQKLWSQVSKCFTARNGTLIQQRMEHERTKQVTYREVRAKAGSKGGRAKVEHKQKASESLAKASTPSPSSSPSPLKNVPIAAPEKPPDPRVRQFIDWFVTEYAKRRNGAKYVVKGAKDGQTVKSLLQAHPLARLQKHAVILLTTDEEWTENTDRGIGILSAKINWLEDRLAAWERKHGTGSAA